VKSVHRLKELQSITCNACSIYHCSDAELATSAPCARPMRQTVVPCMRYALPVVYLA
jgi:hypothetical protein